MTSFSRPPGCHGTWKRNNLGHMSAGGKYLFTISYSGLGRFSGGYVASPESVVSSQSGLPYAETWLLFMLHVACCIHNAIAQYQTTHSLCYALPRYMGTRGDLHKIGMSVKGCLKENCLIRQMGYHICSILTPGSSLRFNVILATAPGRPRSLD
jgi:hypothetical protein